MIRRWTALTLVGAALFVQALLPAHAEVPVPEFTARVLDKTGTLSADERQTLENRLAQFEAEKGSQIAVLIVPTTEPETIEQYSIRVAEQWQLGRKGVDDGALLVVAKEDRTVRIEVGYGLEGALTDATTSRIIREVIVPLFKHGSFFAGIDAGLDRMIKVIEGEPLPPPDPEPYANERAIESLLPIIIVLSLIAGPLFRRMFGRVLGAGVTGGAVGVVAWLVSTLLGIAVGAGILAFLFTLIFGGMSLGGPGGWSNRGRYSGSGGGWSGGSSGGFSGGGGGSFGGGGASGSW